MHATSSSSAPGERKPSSGGVLRAPPPLAAHRVSGKSGVAAGPMLMLQCSSAEKRARTPSIVSPSLVRRRDALEGTVFVWQRCSLGCTCAGSLQCPVPGGKRQGARGSVFSALTGSSRWQSCASQIMAEECEGRKRCWINPQENRKSTS